jgi:predicted MPP superfamily phosphohydrolase
MSDAQAEPAAMPAMPLSRLIRLLAVISLVLGIIIGLHGYLAWRLVLGAGAQGAVAAAGCAIVATLFLSIPAAMRTSRRAPSRSGHVLLWIAHTWIGTFWILLSTTTIAEVVRAFSGAQWSPSWSASVLVIAALLCIWAFRVARGKAQVRRVTVPVRGLKAPLRIAQISDVHIGQTLRGQHLRRIVDQVNGLKPDVVAVTGDLVDGFVGTIRNEVAPLADLRANHAVLYVTGNHECYYGASAWEAEVARLGLTVLHNEHRLIESPAGTVAFAGVTDFNAGQFGEEHACRPDQALGGIPADVPRILLAHQPRTAGIVGGDRVDLQLSGHTHGGQIFPFNFFVRLQQPVVAGMGVVSGIQVYAHRGTGYWGPPMRLGVPPEIAEVTLVPA